MKIKDLFIQLALTYRLSLKTMMKITGKSHEEIYNEFIYQYHYINLDAGNYKTLRFLFEYETTNEDETVTKQKYLMAKKFIKEYKYGNTEVKQRLIATLCDIDYQFKKVKEKIRNNGNLDENDKNILTKYRLKYALSQREIMDIINQNAKLLSLFEASIIDPVIQSKLRVLNDYHKETAHIEYQKKK